MKVKVGGLIYDSETSPIMVFLEDHEKQDIANMAPSDHKYCVFPEECEEDFIKKFMEVI